MNAREQIVGVLYNHHRRRPRSGDLPLDLAKIGAAIAPLVLGGAEIAAIVESLLAEGLLAREGEGFVVHPDAIELARAMYRKAMARSFGDWLVRAEDSAAHQQFCAEVYDTGLFQFDMLDKVQIEAAIAALALAPGALAVDLGCATGALTEHIAQRTGAHIHGIDIAERAIARAQQRTTRGLSFEVLAIEDWQPLPGRWSAVTSFDTIYFVEDLPRLASAALSGLAPGGVWVTFLSAHARDGEPLSSIDAEETPFGRALFAAAAARGARIEAQEFTEETHAYWRRSADAVARLRPRFEAEGSLDLWESRRKETEEVLASHDAGRSRRWMYVARAT